MFGYPTPDIDFVTPSLAVGGAPESMRDVHELARLRIGSILDLRMEDRPDASAYRELGIRLLHLPTPDRQPISQEDLETGTAWVLDQLGEGRKVLVHCQYGVGRSVIMTAAVLVLIGYPWQVALRLVKSKRLCAMPDERQVAALAAFARRHEERRREGESTAKDTRGHGRASPRSESAATPV